jgi:prefoldin alpha subunit
MSALAKANQEVDITKISPQQLQELGQAIEEEVKQLSVHYQSMITAIRKFSDSKGVLNFTDKYASGKEIMVPLTSSLYVPGVLNEENNVLIEAGAGYFIERPIDKALEYLERKQKTLQESSNKVATLIQTKQAQLKRIEAEYVKRVQAVQAQMAAQQK